MNISYSEPLSRAWLRMKILLFRPFDMGIWFALGFTAFLAGLADGAGSQGGNFTNRLKGDSDFEDVGEIARNFGDSTQDFLDTGWGIGLVLLAGMVIIVFGLLALWLSSRGRFMFLDNLVHSRTKVKQPWHEFASLGDSLFLWQIVYTIILLAVVGLCMLMGFSLFAPLIGWDVGWVIAAPLVILAGTISFILFVAMLYIDFFLTAFVVPIMHKERISTMAAWSRFLPLFQENPGSFILCGFFYLLISVLAFFAFMLGGLLTCCVGLILLAIPYVGSVITLPASVTLRYFTLDFLGQFGDDFRLLDPVKDGPRPSPYAPPEDLTDLNHHRAVIGTEDLGEDGSTNEPGPQSGGD